MTIKETVTMIRTLHYRSQLHVDQFMEYWMGAASHNNHPPPPHPIQHTHTSGLEQNLL